MKKSNLFHLLFLFLQRRVLFRRWGDLLWSSDQRGDQSYLDAKNMVLRESHIQKLTMQKQFYVILNAVMSFWKMWFFNLEWIGGSFHQVVFHQCKLTGTNFAESYLRDCTFTDCIASMASFSSTNLKAVSFDHCQLEDSEFYEVTWKNLFCLTISWPVRTGFELLWKD